jgi:signal transduction histidine kinase/CheY-like chemotaxis protein
MIEERFVGAGEIRERIRTFPWETTPLGPLAAWPKTLVGYVEMILAMPTPAIIFWGPDQTQVYNEGYAQIMGPRHPRYFGAPYRECWPDTYPTIYPFMQDVLRGGIAQFENTLFPLTRYGFLEEAYFTFTFSPLRDDSGAIAGIFQPVVEVTDAVLADRRTATLRMIAQRKESIDATTPDAMAAFENDAEDIPVSAIFLCDEATSALRLTAASEALRGCDPDALMAIAVEAFERGAPSHLQDFGARVGSAAALPSGERTRGAFAVPLLRSGSHATRGVVLFGLSPRLFFNDAYRSFLESAATLFADARERAVLEERERLARREAELQKEHLTALFMQAPVPICVLRGASHVVDLANPRMCAVWRRSPEAVVGKPLFEAIPELGGQGFGPLLDDVLRSAKAYLGKEMRALMRGPNDDGPHEAYFNFVYEPLRTVDGRAEGVLVVAVDVTEDVHARKKMAELRDAAERENRSKDEFLAMLSHELRNPLAAVVTSLHLVREALPESVVDRQLGVIERQVQNLRRIVDDLLEVSRITQGKIELRKEPLDVTDVVSAALETVHPALEARQHELVTSFPRECVRILGDRVRIEQVVVNLLANAAKYTDPGGRIEVTVMPRDDMAEIRVRDNGVGIADDLRPRLFQLFQQGQRDASRAQGGLGVGLTIVRRLVELHGGTIDVRSEGAGLGSEFRIRFPALPATDTSSLETESNETGARIGGAGTAGAGVAKAGAVPCEGASARRRVLIVDDNEDAAEMLAMVLDRLGHQTKTAFDGPSALALMKSWTPDVMFVDIGLPGMTGYEVAREVARGAEGADVRPKLVALTGYGQDTDKRKALEAGFDEHLVKPATIAAVSEAVGRA